MIKPTKKQKKQSDKLLKQALRDTEREFWEFAQNQTCGHFCISPEEKVILNFFLKKLALQKMMLDQVGVYMDMTNEKFLLVFDELEKRERKIGKQ